MVGGEIVHQSLTQRRDQRQPVFSATQRRIHLQPQTILVRQHGVVEEQVVRSSLGRNANSPRFGRSDLLQAALG